MQGVSRPSTVQSSSTSSRSPSWLTLPMVSGQRVICPYPSPSTMDTTSRRVSRAVSRASRRVRFISAPEWIVTRVAPIQSAARQAARIYPAVFFRLSGSGLARLMK